MSEAIMSGRKINDTSRRRTAVQALVSCGAFCLALGAGGCGGGGYGTSPPVSAKSSPAATTASTAAAPHPATVAHVSILAPHRGASTDATLTVRVALAGAQPSTPTRLRYVLDGRLTRTGGARMTYHELAPGRHRLAVRLLGQAGAVAAATSFTVRAPAPPPAPAAPAPATMTETRQEEATAPAPSRPSAHGGIPQGGGGDVTAGTHPEGRRPVPKRRVSDGRCGRTGPSAPEPAAGG